MTALPFFHRMILPMISILLAVMLTQTAMSGLRMGSFSQPYEDMDVTLHRLAQNFYVVRHSLVPFCVVARRIRRKVGVLGSIPRLPPQPLSRRQWTTIHIKAQTKKHCRRFRFK